MKMKKAGALLLTGLVAAGTVSGYGVMGDGVVRAADDGAKEFEGVTLTLLKEQALPDAGLNEVIKLAKEKLGLTVEVERRVDGSDGDNIVKTRLASGDMTDLCMYNSGSLFKALNPEEYFIDISNEEFASRLDDSYRETVSVDGAAYGIPASASQAGAILYYKPTYEELGLSVPKTWDEFLENCEAIQKAGKVAVCGTFGDAWTSQMVFLGDNYNVLAAEPDFPGKFESGEAKYASTPAALRSFQKLDDVRKYYNDDYTAATYDDGCDMIANGEAAHWVILTKSLTNIYDLYPEAIDNIGVFGIPGDDPQDSGMTTWMPSSIYGNKNSENQDAILAFMDLYTSKEGLDAYTKGILPVGPYCIKDYEIPENAYKAVREDMQRYFDEGKTKVALEFITAVKGPNSAAICQELGSGQTTPEEAAQAYDEDCKKQAVQLGLNWE